MTNPATSFAIWIEPVLNRWKSILVAIATIFGTLYGGYAFAQQQFDDAVNSRVEAKFNILLAGMAEKKDVKGLTRRLNGVQSKLNESAQNLRRIEEANEQRSKSIDKQLNLIIKLIEQK